MLAAPAMRIDDGKFPVMVFLGRGIPRVNRGITMTTAIAIFMLPEKLTGHTLAILEKLIRLVHDYAKGSAQRNKGAQCSQSCLQRDSGISNIDMPWADACT